MPDNVFNSGSIEVLKIKLHRNSSQFNDSQWNGLVNLCNGKIPVLLKNLNKEENLNSNPNDPEYSCADKVIGFLDSLILLDNTTNEITLLCYPRLIGGLTSDLRLYNFEFNENGCLCAIWVALKSNSDSNNN